jgi:iron complex transport system substrate-binding protein
MSYPSRIICLTEETTEIIYKLGGDEKIVGISSFTERPESAKKQKPRISSFTSINSKKIKELNPDLILAFSDVQAEIVKKLIKEGYQVLVLTKEP